MKSTFCKIKTRALLTLSLFLLMPLATLAQDDESWHCYGGVYKAYSAPSPSTHYTTPPAGYTPVYISHFARHGSRWLPSEERYENVLHTFQDTLNLTALGRDVRHRLLLIAADAHGRAGDLTALGARQHRDMAQRMVERYPTIFCDSAVVSARSSIVGRCIMSMHAFTLRLAQLKPTLDIQAEAHHRYMNYIAYTSPAIKALEDSIQSRWVMDPSRLMKSLFIQPLQGEAARNLASELHTLASDMQNVRIGISLYDIFTQKEMQQIYDMHNERMERCNGCNDPHRIPQQCAASLWQNIVCQADCALSQGTPAASLRFGHDTSLYRLLSLLGLYNGEKRMDVIIPMGANLQLIFYRNTAGHVLVKFMHNEREVCLPLASPNAPYYDWETVKLHYPPLQPVITSNHNT